MQRGDTVLSSGSLLGIGLSSKLPTTGFGRSRFAREVPRALPGKRAPWELETTQKQAYHKPAGSETERGGAPLFARYPRQKSWYLQGIVSLPNS